MKYSYKVYREINIEKFRTVIILEQAALSKSRSCNDKTDDICPEAVDPESREFNLEMRSDFAKAENSIQRYVHILRIIR